MKVVILFIVIVLLITYFRKQKKPKAVAPEIAPDQMHDQLSKHVTFYERLNSTEQELFRNRVQHFLATTKITPVDQVQLTALDRLYVGASAIIPIFSFSDWAYNNLDEVLIYPGTFTQDFDTEHEDKNVLGMVGDGAMHRMMILSLPALRAGFEHKGAGNTAIHEFVHLLDKADGATDGIPEYMLPANLVAPWIKYMHQSIREIRGHHSDINPYAATNDAEFFAVISEYFFQKPQLLKEHHPELFDILEAIYKQHPIDN